MLMGVRLAASAAVAVAALAGCSPSGEDADASVHEDAVSAILRSARGDSLVSDEQLAILDRGDVTFADYESAVGRALACLEEGGIHVIGANPVQDAGYPEIRYSYSASSPGRTDVETDAVSEACLRRHSMYIEAAYFNSLPVRQAIMNQFEVKRSLIVLCLRELGIEVDDDATVDELNDAIVAGLEDGAGACSPAALSEQ